MIMREIKFRGWDVIGKKWVYGDLVHNQKVTQTGLEPRVMVGGYEVDPESVGVCIGKRDDGGEVLYEGDICSITCFGSLFYASIVYVEPKASFFYSDVRFHGEACGTYPISYASTCRKCGTMYESKDSFHKLQGEVIGRV